MSSTEKRLPAALKRHQRDGNLNRALKAFSTKTGVSRTTTGRWVKGQTMPKSRQDIETLAGCLGDPGIINAWESDREHQDRNVRYVTTRFMKLPLESKEACYREFGRDLLRYHPRLREQFSMEIEIHAGQGLYSRLDITADWTGALPKSARVLVADDEDALGRAFKTDDCIFRELIPGLPGAALEAMATLKLPDPKLRYRPILAGADAEMQQVSSKNATPGIYIFDNDHVERANIFLEVSLAYPSIHTMYPFMFGGYPVKGPANISVRLREGQPVGHALCFIGSIRVDRRVQQLKNKLTMHLGTDSDILPPDAGIVVYWSPDHIRSNPHAGA